MSVLALSDENCQISRYDPIQLSAVYHLLCVDFLAQRDGKVNLWIENSQRLDTEKGKKSGVAVSDH